MENTVSTKQAMELAFGKGRAKKWARDTVLITTLKSTTKEKACYIKIQDLNNLDFDKETDDEYLVVCGYLYRIPRTEVTLHIEKRTGKCYLTESDFGFGYEQVEKCIIEYLNKHIKNKNLYWRSNVNCEEFIIK